MNTEIPIRHILRPYILTAILLTVIFVLLLFPRRGTGGGNGTGNGEGSGDGNGAGREASGFAVAAENTDVRTARIVSAVPAEADAEFVVAPEVSVQTGNGDGTGGGSGFYGIPVESSGSVLFVVDLSSSMNSRLQEGGTRLDFLKNELVRVISTADGKRRLFGDFRILAFTGKTWFVPEKFCRYRDKEAVEKVIQTIRSWNAKGKTDIPAALRAAVTEAVRHKVSDIYFLSDGQSPVTENELAEILRGLPPGVKIHYIPAGVPSAVLEKVLNREKYPGNML